MRSELMRLKRDTDTTGRVAAATSETVAAAQHTSSEAMSHLQTPGTGSSPALTPSPSSSAVAGDKAITASIQNRPYGKIAGAIAAAVVVLVLAALFWIVKQRPTPVVVTANQKTVAVLPLQNLGSNKDVDFLRLALADEIATALSYVR